MGVLAFLMLILIPVSLVYTVMIIVKMRRRGFKDVELKSRLKSRLLIFAAVFVIGLAVLFFNGKFYSLSMTMQMSHIKGAGLANINDKSKPVKIWSDRAVAFTGNKAVTLNVNFDTGTNVGQEIFLAIWNAPDELFFKYSDKYIPKEYRAENADEVGFLIIVRHYSADSGQKYTNGRKAYVHKIDVTICDDKNILAEKTFTGGFAPSTTHSDAIGPAPDNAVSEWVAEQLARLTTRKPASSGKADSGKPGTGNIVSGTWTAKDYSANLEKLPKREALN